MEPIYLIPFALFLAAGGMAFGLGRATGGLSVAIGTGILVAIGGVLAVMASQASGYDGLGFAILAIFGAGPAAAGYLAGGLWGWLTRNKAPDAAPL